MAAYYNENNLEAAQWLRNLIKAGLIADGEVDQRSIKEVKTDEIRGFTQHHFFAGIGGWSLALRMASWPDDKPVWTGSCPCQPFSTAGKQKGASDDRHLWPTWFNLISQLHPAILFGEQVTGAITHGWLDDVQQGLEIQGYAFGSAVLPAIAGQRGHGRDRIFFVGHSQYDGLPAAPQQRGDGKTILGSAEGPNNSSESSGASDIRLMADIAGLGQPRQGEVGESMYPAQGEDGEADKSVNAGTGDFCLQCEKHWEDCNCGNPIPVSAKEFGRWLRCPDGKFRPVEPKIPVLAYGIPAGMARICSIGFGNAIVPQVAAEFIKATM